MSGLKRLIAQGDFTESDLVQAETETYQKSVNTVAMFIDEENYVADSIEVIPQKEMYSAYVDYCKDNGNRPFANRRFGEQLAKLGFSQSRTNVGKIIYAVKKEFN